MGCVYCATNKINGKKYIGKTVYSLEYRKTEHIKLAMRGCRGCTVFYKAIRKHGPDAFDWVVLFYSTNEESLLNAERYEIAWQSTKIPNGYNTADGGLGSSGFRHTEEWKQELSRMNKGSVRSAEDRKRLSESIRANKPRMIELSERFKLMSLARRGKTIIEHYGPEKAAEMSAKASAVRLGKKKRCRKCRQEGHLYRRCPLLTDEEKSKLPKRKKSTLIGKTYDDIYGADAGKYRALRSNKRRTKAQIEAGS